KGRFSQREQLDAILHNDNGCSAPILERIYEAANDLQLGLRFFNAPIDWAMKIQTSAGTTMAQSQSLDTNADSEMLLATTRHPFDPLQTYSRDFGLVDAEQWLNAYWNVVDQTLCALNERRGAEERVSLRLLVEQLCELWERETGRRVT